MSPKSTHPPGSPVDRLKMTYEYLMGARTSRMPDLNEVNREVREALVSSRERQEMIAHLARAAESGLLVSKLSEASIRLLQDRILVTRQGSRFNPPEDEDLILASLKTDEAGEDRQTPAFWDLHQAVYRNIREARAVLIGQPAALMALAGNSLIPEEKYLPQAGQALGKVGLSAPDPGSVANAIQSARVLLIRGVGGLAWGASLVDAAANLEILERWCDITLKANLK